MAVAAGDIYVRVYDRRMLSEGKRITFQPAPLLMHGASSKVRQSQWIHGEDGLSSSGDLHLDNGMAVA